MISLLRQKSDKGSIVASNKDLCDKLLGENPRQITPYTNLIKEKKAESSMDDFISCNTDTRSNLTLKTDKLPARNSVMFNIPNTNENSNLQLQHPSTKKMNMSATIISSIPAGTHSSMSTTTSMDKFNNTNFQHEKKRLSRKKLRHVQQQLETRMSVKSATTIDLYKELNRIILDENKLGEKITRRIEQTEREKERKREIIYKNWYRNVYEPIQDGIYNMMLSTDAQYARKIRNSKYLEYLNQCNKRQSVFQDDFEPTEYDPIHMLNLDASVSCKLLDPTTLAQRKVDKELGLMRTNMQRLPTIRRANSPRSDVVWNNWILDQYNTIDSGVRAKSAKKCNSSRYSSEYNLDWDRGSVLGD